MWLQLAFVTRQAIAGTISGAPEDSRRSVAHTSSCREALLLHVLTMTPLARCRYEANLLDDLTGCIPPYDKFIMPGPMSPQVCSASPLPLPAW